MSMKDLMHLDGAQLRAVLVETVEAVREVNRMESFVKALDTSQRMAKGVPEAIQEYVLGISEQYRDDFYRVLNVQVEALAALAYAEECLFTVDTGNHEEVKYYKEKIEVLREILLATEIKAEELDSNKAKLERHELCAKFFETKKLDGYHDGVDFVIEEEDLDIYK